jgi:hypothetical protein
MARRAKATTARGSKERQQVIRRIVAVRNKRATVEKRLRKLDVQVEELNRELDQLVQHMMACV